MESPIYSQAVRSTGDNLDLPLVSEICVYGEREVRGRVQSSGTEPLTCGICATPK